MLKYLCIQNDKHGHFGDKHDSIAIVEVKVFYKWAKRGSMSSMPVSST